MGKEEDCRVINLGQRRRKKKYSFFYDFFNSFVIFFKIGKKDTVKNHMSRPVNH